MQLVERNYRKRFGELDIVMLDTRSLVFVEVRYRADTRWGDGLASVTRAKQRKLILAAGSYLKTHPELARRPARFDVVSIQGRPEQAEVRWVKNAFDSG